MNLRISLILILSVILSFSTRSYAAFPAGKQQAEIKVKEQQTLRQNLKQAVIHFKKTEPKATTADSADTFGIVALVAGILGFLLMFVPTIGVLFIPMAIAALVFGILGLKGNNKGLAIAGIILGGVELLLLLLAIVFVAALLAAL